MCMVYMTQALDKGALGPVSIMGWLEDVNAQGQGMCAFCDEAHTPLCLTRC